MKRSILVFLGYLLLLTLLSKCSESSPTTPEVVDCNTSNLKLTVVNIQNTNCGDNTGRIEVRGEGGNSNYRYSLNGGPQSTSGIFEGLPSGIQFITVRDELNCTAEEQVLLASGISLDNDVFSRIGETCAVVGCHVAGGQSPNFELKTNIRSAAQNIKRRLEDNSMPPADSGRDPMKDEDKALVICWINDGALDN